MAMTPGAPALRGRPCAWNAFVIVQADKVIVVARRADCRRFCLFLPSLVEAGQKLSIRPPGPHPDRSPAGIPSAAACARHNPLTSDKTLPRSKIAFAIGVVRLADDLKALTQSPLKVGALSAGLRERGQSCRNVPDEAIFRS